MAEQRIFKKLISMTNVFVEKSDRRVRIGEIVLTLFLTNNDRKQGDALSIAAV